MSIFNHLEEKQAVKLDKEQLLSILTAIRLSDWIERVGYELALSSAYDEALEIVKYVGERVKR